MLCPYEKYLLVLVRIIAIAPSKSTPNRRDTALPCPFFANNNIILFEYVGVFGV